MKINITEQIQKSRNGDKTAANIEYFLIHLIAELKDEFKDVRPPNTTVDVEVKINGIEVDFLEFVTHSFSQFDRMVQEKVNEKTMEVENGLKNKFSDLLNQFMHKNGLIDTDEYYKKISGF